LDGDVQSQPNLVASSPHISGKRDWTPSLRNKKTASELGVTLEAVMEHEVVGSAVVVGRADSDVMVPRTDGPVLRDTLEAMQFGVGGAKPTPPPLLERVVKQATRVVSRILGAYSAEVARGEVGPGGSAFASAAPPEAGRCPTGLLYGRVQSGKTLAMIVSTALALDNGFRVVIVLTSDNVSLVDQTAVRFGALQGVRVKSSTEIGSWLDDVAHGKASLAEGGLVLVTAKNTSHLQTFINYLTSIDAFRYPALILDDEADQASLDTNLRRRSLGIVAGDPGRNDLPPSAINDWTNGSGLSLRSTLPHHLYLQVTATPQALWLQNLSSVLKPSFTELLDPGEGYVGSGHFFAKDVVDERRPPLVLVDEAELGQPAHDGRLPAGLQAAIGYFLVAAAAQGLAHREMSFGQQNFLCHTSMRRDEHKKVADLIKHYLDEIYACLRGDAPADAVRLSLLRGRTELGRTVQSLPSEPEVEAYIRKRLQNREVKIVNSDQDPAKFGPSLNFIIGGNILGRGLTIENLLVTYYLRSAKVAQLDTMLQHARMFGYRTEDQAYLRVYLPELQAVRFHEIHKSEEELRSLLVSDHDRAGVPVAVAGNLRATRLGVLDVRTLQVFKPGQHLYPTLPLSLNRAGAPDRSRSEAVHEDARRKALELFPKGSSPFTKRRPGEDEGEHLVRVTTEQLIAALEWIPLPRDPGERGNWVTPAIRNVLRATRALFSGQGFVYAREANRETLTEGMLSQKELKKFGGLSRPVLCLFWDPSNEETVKQRKGKALAAIEFPYLFPELVFPKSNEKKEPFQPRVFNDDEDEDDGDTAGVENGGA
jgi:hypothetical protein